MGADPLQPGPAHLIELLNRIPDLFRQSWDAVALYALDGTLLRGNRIAATMVGDEDLAGRHFFVHMSPEARARAQREFEKAVLSGTTREFESVFAGNNGRKLEVEIRLVPAHVDGVLVGIFGLARDVTARKTAERQTFIGQQQMLALFENHPDSITMMDMDGRYLMVNRAAVALTGFTPSEFVGRTSSELFDTEHPEHFAFLVDAIRAGEPLTYETHSTAKDGRTLAIDGTLIPIRIDGELFGAFSASKDTTAKRAYESRLTRDGERMRHLYQIAAARGLSSEQRVERALRDGMQQLNADGAFLARIRDGIVTVEQSIGKGYGFDPGYSVDIAHSFVRLVAEASDDFLFIEDLHVAPWIDDISGRARLWRGFVGVRLMVGEQLYGVAGFITTQRMLALEETDREYITAIVSLIAMAVERSMQYQRLNDLAHQDALTGLPNRALLLDRLDQTLLQSRRFKRTFAVHFLDFDDFKDVNDQYGHAAGDQLLIAASSAMAKTLRESDTLARVGGDEFVVLQPEIRSIEDANASRERIRAALLQPFVLDKWTVHVSVSAGTAVFPQDGENAAQLLEAADQALYRAKGDKHVTVDNAEITGVSSDLAATSYASLHHLICDCGHTAFSHGSRGCRVPHRNNGHLANCPCTRTLEYIYAHSAKPRVRRGESETRAFDT